MAALGISEEELVYTASFSRRTRRPATTSNVKPKRAATPTPAPMPASRQSKLLPDDESDEPGEMWGPDPGGGSPKRVERPVGRSTLRG